MENKKLDMENLEQVSGGQGFSGMIWYTTHDVEVGPGKYLTIRYTPNGAINYGVHFPGNKISASSAEETPIPYITAFSEESRCS